MGGWRGGGGGGGGVGGRGGGVDGKYPRSIEIWWGSRENLAD